MRFSQSLLLGLLAGHGLAQTAGVEPVEEQPSAVAPEPSAPAAEEPSAVAPVEEPTQDNDTPAATAEPDAPKESAAAPEESNAAATEAPKEEPTSADDAEPSGVSATNDDSKPTESPEETGTAEASATGNDDDDATTAQETGTATEDATGVTKTSSSVSTATATAAVVKVDLKNATVGDNAEIVEVEGKTAVKLSAPVDGEATFSVSVDTDDDFDADELIYIVASILVGEPSTSAKLRRRGAKTDCNLQMKLNGQTVYDEPLSTTDGKFQDVSSTGLQSADPKPKIDVTQKCGKTPAPLTVNNVQVANENSLGSSSGGSGSGSGGSGSGSGSGGKGSGGSGSDSESGSKTGSGSGSSETGDPNAGSKAATSVVGLVAAMAAVLFFM